MTCATRQWIHTRQLIDWASEPADRKALGSQHSDGILAYISDTALTRGFARAARLRAALDLERTSNEVLSLHMLATWQRIIEPDKAALRTTSAFAKGGDEQYTYWDGMWKLLDKFLSEAKDKDIPLAARAARAYLDICFFHPFLDGNGRTALLALDHTLQQEGISLRSVGMILRIPYYANDAHAAMNFVRQLSLLLAMQ